MNYANTKVTAYTAHKVKDEASYKARETTKTTKVKTGLTKGRIILVLGQISLCPNIPGGRQHGYSEKTDNQQD